MTPLAWMEEPTVAALSPALSWSQVSELDMQVASTHSVWLTERSFEIVPLAERLADLEDAIGGLVEPSEEERAAFARAFAESLQPVRGSVKKGDQHFRLGF